MGSYKKILVGTDGSDTSMLAVDRAAALAGDSGAELVIVTAYEPASKEEVKAASDALKSDAYQIVGSAPAESVLRDAADRARSGGATKVETTALQGPPVDVLDQAVADSSADLLVVGNVGLNTLTGRILGSVPQSVARRAGVDVLIVHTT
ncbi:universal stress protein [Pseudonocardia spinosispora]|uniref:universal stress protein n=1 Tax=Pseudonocardia spinosispora TaxID=103441 RepID=UPI0003F4F330|nr:universal stress protein [Pseudonocardia spinosispora]